IPPGIRDRIVRQTDGVPLFLEEKTKFVIEQLPRHRPEGVEELLNPTNDRGIVLSLADSLAARLDQLDHNKEVAQVASVIGRSFSSSLLKQVVDRDAATVAEALSQMVDLGLATRLLTRGDADYSFRHALIQEAAYRSLLRRRRQAVHRRVALALRARGGGREAAPEILAHHYAEAGLVEEAIASLQEAGRLAASRSANLEAARRLQRALRLLESQPAGDARDERELALLVSLGPVMITTAGPGAAEVQKTYQRAVDLCGRLPRNALHFTAHW